MSEKTTAPCYMKAYMNIADEHINDRIHAFTLDANAIEQKAKDNTKRLLGSKKKVSMIQISRR